MTDTIEPHFRGLPTPRCESANCKSRATKELISHYGHPIGKYCAKCSKRKLARALKEWRQHEATFNPPPPPTEEEIQENAESIYVRERGKTVTLASLPEDRRAYWVDKWRREREVIE